jgi:hypothetical protein
MYIWLCFFCPVAVYTLILCSCMPLKEVFVVRSSLFTPNKYLYMCFSLQVDRGLNNYTGPEPNELFKQTQSSVLEPSLACPKWLQQYRQFHEQNKGTANATYLVQYLPKNVYMSGLGKCSWFCCNFADVQLVSLRGAMSCNTLQITYVTRFIFLLHRLASNSSSSRTYTNQG